MLVICFINQRMKSSKQGLFVSPPKKTIIWIGEGIVRLANSVAV